KGTNTFSTLSTPLKIVLSPPDAFNPSALLMPGLLRSASTRRTRLPFWARTTAEFMLTVVLPSWGKALVTKTTFGGAPKEESRIDVRNARYDSAISDCGRRCVTGPVSAALLTTDEFDGKRRRPFSAI